MSETIWVNGRRREVTSQMKAHIMATRERGGRCFFVVPDTDALSGSLDRPVVCSNCNDNHQLLLQIVSGGPYDTAPAGTPAFFEDGQWYAVRTQTYRCPACRPEPTESEKNRDPDVIVL